MANPEQHDLGVDATIVRIEQQTPTVKSFLFDLGGAQLTFLPGQWVDLYIDTRLSAPRDQSGSGRSRTLQTLPA